MKKELPPPLENALRALLREHYGIAARQLRQLPGELDLNVYVASTEGGAYLLKISHEGEDEACLHMQVAALRHLAQHAPELQLSRVIPTRSGAFLQEVEVQGRQCLMRLLSWVPGRLWARVSPHTPALLQSLGEVCGRLSAALQHFEHPAAHRSLRWDPARAQWVAPYLEAFEQPAQRDCARYCWQLFQQQALPLLPRLPASINHNDANDYNILVNEARGYEARVTGLIDFGDMVYTRRVNELAIACAYACMHKPDPLQAALPIVAGYHRHMPLNEDELAALWPLMATRLLISVTASLLNRRQHPDNAYLQISEAPAWALMEKIRHIPPALAHYSFRQVCGLPPCPQRSAFDRWIARHRPSWGPVLDPQVLQAGLHLFDLSVGSTELGNVADFDSARGMQRRLQAVLEEADAGAGIGAYGEARPFYSTDNYREMGNEGPRWRTVHLGVDVFLPPGTAVRAPYPGRVHSFANRAAERDYGPVVILEHELEDGLKVFSLYGHLSRESLRGLQTGMTVERGQQIGKLGNIDENGGWPPHLHFQLMLDMLGMEGDFPGAAFPGQREVFCSICPDPSGLLVPQPLPQPAPQPDVATLLRKRQQLLGRSLSLSYHQPLYIRRGYLQHLYAADGRRYLDTVNNVPHLGHQHPRVVSAARRQMAVLNTNTRYLHETILEYAQTLLARVPQPLSVVHFVNSGSEANELALRMAQAYSGQQDMLVLETGYHGNTNACIAISSYKFDGKGGTGAPPHVQVLPMPDSYRGRYRGLDSRLGEQYARHAAEAIARVQAQGRGIAGFIAESIMSCGGQIVLPPGYLQQVYQLVRAAGGLCIADEVQVGFGRVGEAFWGFELQAVVPDILTLGKPIGNGHPLGAVVCTPAVAEAFANGMEYFNTFGGNPVSCTIGLEVLRVIEEEGLQQKALHTGNYLLQGLRELMQRHEIIGDVRGKGLFLGMELVKSRQQRLPAPEAASYLANRMRERGILMSTDGPSHNVLKIKPPLAFNRQDATCLLENLDLVLKEDAMQAETGA